MKEVTKEEFKAIFLKYGKRDDGWGKGYWNSYYRFPKKRNMRYLVELPKNPKENRMMIVNDYSNNEIRLFFMSLEEEEAFFDFPGKE